MRLSGQDIAEREECHAKHNHTNHPDKAAQLALVQVLPGPHMRIRSGFSAPAARCPFARVPGRCAFRRWCCMSKHRSLDEDFWKDPKLRKEPMHLRMLLAGLITEAADDEGRFTVEPYGWLDAYFARHDPITEEDISAAWKRLCELGICVEYGDGQYGFLRAWFRRQLVQNPRPSTLPTPDPMDGVVTGRIMMGAVYSLYLAQAGGKGKSWNTVAAHWWASLEPEERLKLAGGTQEEVTVNAPLAEVTYSKLLFRLGRDVKGRERTKGNGLTASAPPAGAADCLDAVASPPEPPAEPDLVLVPPVDPQAPAPKRTRAKTDRDLAFEACLTACRVDPADLEPEAYATYAKAMGKLVAAHSLEELTAWAATASADGGRALGTGAKPEVKVPRIVRQDLTAETWAGTFAAARAKAKHNGQRFIEHSVNGRIYERDWTEDMHGTVALYSSQGLWDDERGMTTIDPRHPSRQ